jgi:hypothetical protein
MAAMFTTIWSNMQNIYVLALQWNILSDIIGSRIQSMQMNL